MHAATRGTSRKKLQTSSIGRAMTNCWFSFMALFVAPPSFGLQRLGIRRQRAGRYQKRNVGRGWPADADGIGAAIGLDRMLDADGDMNDASRVERQRDVVGVVVDGPLAFEDEDRILRQRVNVGNVALASLEEDVVEVRLP